MPPTNSTLLEPRLTRKQQQQQQQQHNDDGSKSTVTSSGGEQLQEDLIEYSVHTLPKPLLREFHHVFGENYLKDLSSTTETTMTMNDETMQVDTSSSSMELLAIPTNQHAREDLVAVGDHVELEKDRLLNVFLEFGSDVCKHIRDMGYWADYIDPCSGLPMMTRDCNKVYSEVDGMECLLNYKAYNAGFCKILTHPKWGSSVYPATIFAYGPKRQLVEWIQSAYPSV